MREYFRSAWRSIRRKSGRAGLTILSIAIGVMSVVLVGAIGDAGKMTVRNELDSMGVEGLSVSAGSYGTLASVPLRQRELETIRNVAGVENAMPLLMHYTDTYLKSEKSDSLVWGIDSGAKQVISLDLLHGRFISRSDVSRGARVCLIDQTYALECYGRENIVGKTVEISAQGKKRSYEIVGIVEAGSGLLQNLIGNFVPSMLYVPYTTLQADADIERFDQIAVKVHDGFDIEQTRASILSALKQAGGSQSSFFAENLTTQRDQLLGLMELVSLILSLLGGISLLVAGLGIMTIMLVSVGERTREIGIKKAIGARRGKILLEFLFEAVLLTLIGGAVGMTAGISAAAVGFHLLGLPFSVNWSSLAATAGVSFLVGAFFGVYPACKASALSPVEALRSE